jgi:hypothetical protein
MTIAQAGRRYAQNEIDTKAREFANLARVIALSRGDFAKANEVRHDHRVLLGPRVANIIGSGNRIFDITPGQRKTLVPAMDDTSSLADYQTLASAFLASLRNYGCFDAMLPFTRRVPFRVHVGAVTVGASGSTIPQASAKPISRLTLTGTVIDEIKVICIMTFTQELVRFGSGPAGDLFGQELSAAIAVQTDSEFIAQLLAGATSFSSNGVTAEHARVDLRGLSNAVITGVRSQLFLIVPSAIAKAWAFLHTNTGDAAFKDAKWNGGNIGGVPILVSDGVPSGNIILADASQIAAASEGITLDSSKDATIQLDSAPDSPVSGSTNIMSLYQANMVGLRAERYIGVEKLTSTGVAVVTGANYSGDSPG